MRRVDGFIAVLVLMALMAAAAYLAREQEVMTSFAEAVDGDTLRLDGREIRISGIDAPELRQSCTVQRRIYPCGAVARKALDEMLAGRLVTCRISGRDRYGRHLASCEAEGRDIGAALVSRGFAVAYGRYESEEAEARRKKLEIWAGSFERPSDWRKMQSEQDRS